MIFNSHFAFKPCRNFCFQFPFSPGSAVLPRDTELQPWHRCPQPLPAPSAHVNALKSSLPVSAGVSASDHPPQLPELLPTPLLLSSFPAPPLPQEQGEQGSVEGGADTQTPRDSPGLQEMKSPQDLSQGSGEGFREAARSGPPSEGLVGGCKGLKAAARTLGGIWLQLQGAQGSDLY